MALVMLKLPPPSKLPAPTCVQLASGIAKLLEDERAVERVLYLLPNHDLLSFVAAFFERARRPVFFGMASAWHEELLEMAVLDPRSGHCSRLREVLP